MTRIVGSNGARTADAIRQAGLELIYRRGYEGFGLRELAQSVGLQPASLYNHIASKQALLFDLISGHMIDLIARTEAVLDSSGDTPTSRLAAFTAHHLGYHIDKKYEVYVANFELRALSAENLAFVLAQRRHYEALLIGILDAGARAGTMAVLDTHVAAYAILAMLTGACTWYRPDGRLSKAQLIELHTGLVLQGCVQPGAAREAARTLPRPEKPVSRKTLSRPRSIKEARQWT